MNTNFFQKYSVLAKKNKKLSIGIILFVIFIVPNLYAEYNLNHLRNDATIIFPQGQIEVQIASTDKEKERGLSFHNQISDKEGLLFVFDRPGKYGFWMKDMKFPLDILWISSDNRIVHIEENVATNTFPNAFINDAQAKYVVEIKAGTRKALGAFLGTEIKMTGL